MADDDLALIDSIDTSLAPWEAPDAAGTLDELHDDEIPTPRIVVDGKTCQFVNSDTSERYDDLEVIILGLVRNRVMWDRNATPRDGMTPLCRSNDAVTGRPNISDDIPVKEQFPWKKSNFTRSELPVEPNTDQPLAPCKDCVFAEWGNDNERPPCDERLTLPVFYKDSFGKWATGILTFKGAGFRATTRYLGAIKARKQQSFMFRTKITLEPQRSGEVDYATPKFERLGLSDPGMVERDGKKIAQNWIDSFNAFEQIKDFLRRAPRVAEDRYEDEAYQASKPTEDQTPDNSNTAPKSKSAPKTEEPVQDVLDAEVVDESAPVDAPPDDDADDAF